MKLAQYRGPTAEADATAVRDAQDAAYNWTDHHATVRRTGAQGMAVPHWTGVERSADGQVYAVQVFEDAAEGIPATRGELTIAAPQHKLLTGALHRQKQLPDFDPESPASAGQIGLAIAKENVAKAAYQTQLDKNPADLPAAAIAARDAVFEEQQAEELGP